jgi:large subunit ribosomal protein L20
MSRVKRSVHARKKRRATLERTKGFRGEAHSSYKRAKEALLKADSYAYRDRRNRSATSAVSGSPASTPPRGVRE